MDETEAALFDFFTGGRSGAFVLESDARGLFLPISDIRVSQKHDEIFQITY